MQDEAGNKLLARAIIASQFAPPFMFAGVAVALPDMGTQLHAGAVSLGLVESLFLGAQLAFLLTVGRLADGSDKRTLYKYGLLAFGLTSLLISMLSSVPAILALRFVQGMTAAVFAATGPAILAEIVPSDQRGRAYGSSIGSIYTGLMLGPLIGGFLSDWWGWRAVFVAGGVVLLVAGILVLRLLPSAWRRPSRGTVHLPSTALVVATVLCLIAGSSLVAQGLAGYLCLLAGLALAAWFVRLQLRLKNPLLDLRALGGNHVLRYSLLAQFLLYLSGASTVFLTSLYLQVSLGESSAVTGQVIAAGTILMVFIAPFSGRLADRYPPTRVAAFGLACVIVSLLMGVSLDAASSLIFVTAMFTLHGIGFAFFSSPNMTLIMNSVGAGETGMASALGAKARSLGMTLGMLIATLLIALHYGNAPIARFPERFAEIPGTAYAVLAVLVTLALAACLAAGNNRAKR